MKNLYLELAEKLAALEHIRWVDLWHDQIGFIEEEHPFPAPAIFLSFRVIETQDIGPRSQQLRMQVEVYLYFETLADTYHLAINQASAVAFLDILDAIYTQLHGSTGAHYSEMRRVAFNPVDTGGAGNLYLTRFECFVLDEAAQKQYVDAGELEVEVTNEAAPEAEESDGDDLFILALG